MIFEIRFTSEAEETYDALSAQLQQRWGKRLSPINFQNAAGGIER